MKRRILCIIGTRPEAIKMAPVIWALEKEKCYEPLVLSAGQHGELLAPLFDLFAIKPTAMVESIPGGQPLHELTARLLERITPIIATINPAVTLVHGDTTTCLAGTLASFYAGVPIVHVEAGLRTNLITEPFPEEMNRRLTSVAAALHLAPTQRASENLRSEGIPSEFIEVTGNTAIDALEWTLKHTKPPIEPPWAEAAAQAKRLILLTTHRRENQGAAMRSAVGAVCRVVTRYDDVAVVIPVHPNPLVHAAVAAATNGAPRVFLLPPLRYEAFVHLMQACAIIVTDSGGIQEEAPALGRPVLILRNTTERMEVVEAHKAMLVGVDPDRIAAALQLLLDDAETYQSMAAPAQIFGDGAAASRVVAALNHHWRRLYSGLI